MKQFNFYQLMGDMEILEEVGVKPLSGFRTAGRVAKKVGSAPAGKTLGLAALGTAGAAAGLGYGAYKAVKGVAKGAVNAMRYPFRPYERPEERDGENVEESSKTNKQKFLKTTQLDEYLQSLDEKLNAKNVAAKGYNWVKNKWSGGFRTPTKNLGGPGVKSWKQHKE